MTDAEQDERRPPTKAEEAGAREFHASWCNCGGYGVDDLASARRELARD